MSSNIDQLEHMIEVIVRMIPVERRARDVYSKTARTAHSERTRILFEEMAGQEKDHLGKLLAALRVLQDEFEEAKRGDKALQS